MWIESEHAIAFAADPPAVEGHIMVVPKEHISSIHVLPMAAQQGVWALVSEARGRLRTRLVPDGGLDGVTATVLVSTHRDPRGPAPDGGSR